MKEDILVIDEFMNNEWFDFTEKLEGIDKENAKIIKGYMDDFLDFIVDKYELS